MSRFNSVADVLDERADDDFELPAEDLDIAEDDSDEDFEAEDLADIELQDRNRERIQGLNFRRNLQWTFDTTSEIEYGWEE